MPYFNPRLVAGLAIGIALIATPAVFANASHNTIKVPLSCNALLALPPNIVLTAGDLQGCIKSLILLGHGKLTVIDTGSGSSNTYVSGGPAGANGTNGTNGANGSNGDKGDKGDKGDPGNDGKDGADGPQGDPGPQGPPGADGEGDGCDGHSDGTPAC